MLFGSFVGDSPLQPIGRQLLVRSMAQSVVVKVKPHSSASTADSKVISSVCTERYIPLLRDKAVHHHGKMSLAHWSRQDREKAS